MEESNRSNSGFTSWGIAIGAVILIVAVVLAVVFTIGTGGSSSGGTTYQAGSFGNTTTGNVNNFMNNITEASNKISSIITVENNIPITYRSGTELGPGMLAAASMDNINDVRGGGIIWLGNNISTDIVIHEILHILGVGSAAMWQNATLTVNGHNFLNRNVFTNMGREYDTLVNSGAINGTVGGNIPLSDNHDSEADGGAHLDEGIFDTEIMTPIADRGQMFISRLTIAALDDLGFTVDYNQSENGSY